MTTTYRVLITCDELRSAWCAGMLELSGHSLRVADDAAFFPLEQGWSRGYSVDQTWDVCPACQTEVTKRALELGSAGKQEGQTEEADRCAEQAEARGRGRDVDGGDRRQDRRDEQQQEMDAGH